MRKFDPEVINAEGREVAPFQDVLQRQGLVKTNRMLLMLVFTLMLLVFMIGFLVLPDFDFVEQAENRQSVAPAVYAVQNPVLSAEINTLKSQLVGLVSGSIESKLRTLEESIRMGSVSASLGTIEDLKNDVKFLRSYSESSQIGHDNHRVDENLIREVAHLKNLIYLTFASCGLMIAAIAGFWLRNRFRLSYREHQDYLEQKK